MTILMSKKGALGWGGGQITLEEGEPGREIGLPMSQLTVGSWAQGSFYL